MLLQIGCETGAVDMVKTLLEAGADVNHRNYLGLSALVFAARQQQLPIVNELIANGANLDARDHTTGHSAFSYACALGYAKVSPKP